MKILRSHTYSTPIKVSLCILLGLLLFLACAPKNTELRSAMREVYSNTASLFRLAWRPAEFKDSRNEGRIRGALSELIENFHTVEQVSAAYQGDPGFTVALQTQETSLQEIRKRFLDGNKDFAIWKLRAITSNCVACHSRYQVTTDFIGDDPGTLDSSFSSKLAAAEFLIATRQFARADKELYQLARTILRLPGGAADAIEALKLWLLVEIRVKNRPKEAADKLERFLLDTNASGDVSDTVQAWRGDLLEIASENKPLEGLERARELLYEVAGNVTLDQDKKELVPTLFASSLLHALLQSEPKTAVRREALYLLALSYTHMPISSLEYFAEIYLEQCIREFPGSDESRKAYAILESLIEFKSSGSSGVHLDSADAESLKRLKELSLQKQKT